MAYCYECGEQVADNDTFCPYCGISLQPVALTGDEKDESFDKTIVVQQPTPPVVTPLETKDDSPAQPAFSLKPDEAPLKEKSFADDFAVSKEQQAEKDTAKDSVKNSLGLDYQDSTPNAVNDQDDWDIPTPKILDNASPYPEKPTSEDKSAHLPSAELDQSPLPSSDSKDVKPIGGLDVKFDFALEDKKDETADNSFKSDVVSANRKQSSDSYDETADNSFKSDVSSPAQSDNFDFDDFSSELDSASDFYPVASGSDERSDYAAEKAEQTSNVDDYPVVEKPIVMPEVELPASEIPPARFDSVSIMEKPEDSAPTTGATGQPEKNAAVNEEAKAEHSHTSPIASGNDTDGKKKAKLKPLDEGTVLNDRYEIIRKIGGGGMGAVYLASDKNLGGVLRAVKEMVQSYIEEEQQEKAVNDFKRESLLLTSLDHQSIPTIFDYFFDEKEARFYLVMKYISGGDLAGRLRSATESRIDEREVTQWAIQISDVLDYLHNRQPPIVYRDLKPANIMIDGNSGRVMLIDFGIARWVNKEEKGVTAVGTMGYAPPELFSGNVEARSDIYSLGSTMFHLLTGADPQSNPLLIFDFQKHPRPRQINSQLSDQMERILMRAVEYNADKRFTSAAELKRTLEEHQENLKTGRVTYGVNAPPTPVALSDQPVFCGFCGQKIVATDMFCAFCGSKQPLAQQGVHSESYSPVPLSAQLLVIGTNDLEQPAFRLEKEDNLVGRRDPMSNIFPEVDLSKYDPQTKISRRHARIWRKGSEFMVEDLGSSNGTYILPVVSDTMRLQPHQPQLLTNGDKLRLGDTTLHFILG